MNKFGEFDLDSENEGDNVVAERDFFDLGGHSNNVLEEMEYLSLHCDGTDCNQTHASVANCAKNQYNNDDAENQHNDKVVPVVFNEYARLPELSFWNPKCTETTRLHADHPSIINADGID